MVENCASRRREDHPDHEGAVKRPQRRRRGAIRACAVACDSSSPKRTNRRNSGVNFTMDSPQLPTPYKLCRLAAALRNPEAENDPLDAIRKALGLWFATLRELTVNGGRKVRRVPVEK